MTLPVALKGVIAAKSDNDLYAYFASADDYTPETLGAVREEIRKRQLPEDQLDELAAAARASAKAKKSRSGDSTFTFNGFGTRFYGKSDFRADGSHVSTMWITALYWPIFPLRSIRLRPLDGRRFEVLERFRTNWPQAGRTYGFISLLVVSVSLASWIGEKYSYNEASVPVLIAGGGLPFLWLFWSRNRERKRCLQMQA